jgi:ABC-type uncharacterized transport system permease subunit
MTPLFLLAALLYLIAAASFTAHLLGRREALLRIGRLALAAALLAHLGFIGLQCVHGMNPLRDVRGALDLSGWLLGVGALLVSMQPRFVVVGLVAAPVSLGLLVVSRLTPAGALAVTSGGATLLGRLHIALVAAGVAIFGVAAAVATIYLIQESALKSKRVSALYRKAPPLAALDDTGRRLISVGFPIFTLAVASGLVWMSRLPGVGIRPEHALAGITWSIFAALILARVTVGWRGRRAALLTLAAFALVVVVLLFYMGRRMLGG